MELNSVDKGWAWVIACACFWTHLTIGGIIFSSGVIFSSVVNTFHVSRLEASWPFTIGNIFAFIGVSISGLLLKILSVRVQVVSSCLICFFGIAFSYFSKDIYSLSILYGALNGFGEGLVNGSSIILISQYFNKYKTIATGILFAGLSASCMILPPLITYLIEEYGINGCFLLLSGIALNGLPAALLYRSAPNIEKDIDDEKIESTSIDSRTSDQFSLVTKETEKSSKIRNVIDELKQWRQVFRYPMYYLITISFGLFCFCYYSYLLIIVDYELDHGIEEETSSFLITIFAVFDLLGRLTIGWFIDFKFLTLRTVSIIMFLLLGILYTTLPFCVDFLPLCFSAAFSGYVDGCIFTNWIVCFTEYLPLSNLTGALGTGALLLGVISLSLPFLIGFYRDVYQSYDLLFYTFGVMQCSCAIFWILEPFFLKLQNKITNKAAELNGRN
ncbi:monocarboxylate transporter 9-like isoform X2 [Centruroides sculpturatus]|uniref:monocarboxylate transporter 9-like isoform X2 n=1 Tax=Centruroides sculpturatus TaxID=218467 RepID=UPI000C6D78FB|nr:monocarboxylate transporter 9-like isoform X2 [Centruroides sculpturatus]